MNDTLEALDVAKTWAGRGVPVFPIAIGWNPDKYAGVGGTEKRPLTQHGHLDATTDLATVYDLFTAPPLRLKDGEVLGVGLWPGPAGLVVVDIDNKGDVNGFVAAEHLGLLDDATYVVETPSGGQHRYYRKPDQTAQFTNASPWDGIDIRADNGWIVAAGTHCEAGSWERLESEWSDVQPLPELVAQQLRTPSTAAAARWGALDAATRATLHPATRAALEHVEQLGGHSAVLVEETGRSPWLKVWRPDKSSGSHGITVGYSSPEAVHIFTSAFGQYRAGGYRHDGDRLVSYEDRIAEWVDQHDGDSDRNDNGDTDDQPRSSWTPISLRSDPDRPQIVPTLLHRTDGEALLTPGSLHSIFGEPESGKGWIACATIVEAVQAGQNAVYIDLEDNEQSIGDRFRALGLDDDTTERHITYLRPDTKPGSDDRDRLRGLVTNASVVVIDSTNEALGLWGASGKDNDDVTRWLRWPRSIAKLGPAVVLIDHVVKNREDRSRYPIGAQAKLAAVDAAFSIDCKTKYARGKDGRSTISVAKDRHGHVRAAATNDHWGTFTLRSSDDGATVRYELGRVGTGAGEPFRPTGYMERISRWLETQPEPASKKTIEEAISGGRDYVRAGLECLVAEGFVERIDGTRNAKLHRSVRQFREVTPQ